MLIEPRTPGWASKFIAAALALSPLTSQAAENGAAANQSKLLSESLPGVLEMLNQHKQHLIKQGVNVTDYNEATSTPANQKASQESISSQLYFGSTTESAYENGKRDPFTVTSLIYKQQQGGATLDGQSSYQRNNVLTRLPKLKLRGIINETTKSDPIALLEIGDEGVHMVKLGDELSFNPADPKQVIKIKKISRLSVVVEIGTLGDLIIVR